MTDIEDAVRAWANGIYPTEAGVELLIRHGKAIYEGAPWIDELEPLAADRPRMAAINVDTLLERTGGWSGGERRIVRIAASLLGDYPVSLYEDLPGLDRRALLLVLAAVAHASGSHEHSDIVLDVDGAPRGFTKLASAYPWPAEDVPA